MIQEPITKRSKSLEDCFQLFMKEGLRAVSVQDIVQCCCISKKDLYESFGNKEGVIKKVLEQDVNKTAELFEQAMEASSNAIEEMIFANQSLLNRVGKINPVLFFDLKKYYSEMSYYHSIEKQQVCKSFLIQNLNHGISEGLYRKNIHKDIVTTLWISKLDMIKEQKWFPLHEYDLHSLAKEFNELHLRSIATAKGNEIINQYYSTETNTE